MSDCCWVTSLARVLLILILSPTSSKGDTEDCTIHCTYDGEGLNCTWPDNITALHVWLECLSEYESPQESPQHYSLPAAQNWLWIPRVNLTLQEDYQLSIIGEDRRLVLNFTFFDDVFAKPPELSSRFVTYDTGEKEILEVTWEKYTEDKLLLRYRIQGDIEWTEVEHGAWEPSCYKLRDGKPYTDYEFQIRYAPNEQDASIGCQWSNIYVFTSPEAAPIGTLDLWRQVDKENALLVEWKPLSRDSARGKVLSYNVTYVHKGPQTTQVPCCHVTLPAMSTNVSVRAENSKGLGPASCLPTSCSGAAGRGGPGGRAWSNSTGNITVWWAEPVKTGPPLDYVVEWKEEGSPAMKWTRSQTENQELVLPGDFRPAVAYVVSVYALYRDACVEIFSDEVYSQEGVPSAAPNFTIHNVTSLGAFISWEEIPKHHMWGKLRNYTIYVHSETGRQLYPVTAQGRNMTLSGLSPRTLYTVWMTASTSAGEGLKSVTKSFQTTGHCQPPYHRCGRDGAPPPSCSTNAITTPIARTASSPDVRL
ncbi:interleukin-27 receptor subunit alpha isoform X2 [Hyperolius riggenbachi]|uniref:interleukin-27 receptor subunit alpha isoform X2 n=1 Tax=Hyperolius riggenbachi TaxID=752182 RepID=UPI0035A2780C